MQHYHHGNFKQVSPNIRVVVDLIEKVRVKDSFSLLSKW